MDMDKLNTITETAKFLKVSDMTVRRYIKQGRIEAQKIGPRQWRITQSAINAFLEQGKTLSDCLSEERQSKQEGA